jgi:hypothetical protein
VEEMLGLLAAVAVLKSSRALHTHHHASEVWC